MYRRKDEIKGNKRCTVKVRQHKPERMKFQTWETDSKNSNREK